MALGQELFGKRIQASYFFVVFPCPLINRQELFLGIEIEMLKIVIGKIIGIRIVADNEQLHEAQQGIAISIAGIVLVIHNLLHGTAWTYIQSLQFHLYGGVEDAARMETRSYFDPAHLLQVLDQLGKLNLPIHISEISLPTYPELPRTLAEEVQGELLRNFYRTWFSQKNCQSIVYWNLCDGTAYGTESRFNAGLISSDFKEKNAYRILDTLVNHEWHTETTVATDENGEAVWNGFYGEYELDFCGKKETVALTPRSENEYLLSLSE